MVGIEPDDCYVFGPTWRGKRRPDLAIEVVWSRGGVSKLEIYRRLFVPEVWSWKKGKIEVYRLRRDGYRRVEASRYVPDIDLDLLLSFVGERTTTETIIAYRAALRRTRHR